MSLAHLLNIKSDHGLNSVNTVDHPKFCESCQKLHQSLLKSTLNILPSRLRNQPWAGKVQQMHLLVKQFQVPRTTKSDGHVIISILWIFMKVHCPCLFITPINIAANKHTQSVM